MDDPWGSPWASANSPSDNDPASSSSQANIILSPPPKAFFGGGTSPSIQSSWAGGHDNHGLGIWSAVDRADGGDNQKGWGVWADSSVQPPRLSPRLSGAGDEWPDNAAPSPIFISNSRSRTPSILRHHSPDPWASELSLTHRPDFEPPTPITASTRDTSTIIAKPIGQDSIASLAATENPVGILTDKEALSTKNEHGSGRAQLVNGADSLDIDHDHGSELVDDRRALDAVAHESPSRPSSTYTIDTHDEPERQDSPITSIDEDRGARIQIDLRKTPTKVQELVGVYNGVARATSEDPSTPDQLGTPLAGSCEELPGQEEANDNGSVGLEEFEDGSEDNDNNRAAQSVDIAPFSSEGSLGQQAVLQDELTRRAILESEEEYIPVTEMDPAQSQHNTMKQWDVTFDIDTTLTDKLFPNLAPCPIEYAAGDSDVPIHVITDSFATISERKAWYRISRFGSMRHHNSGDDGNYHRVTWQTTQLHDETIKIVRRWMEEDTYAGRATLGGTKRTGFFDWDSNAAPIDIGEVFRKKKPLVQHVRATSIPVNNVTTSVTALDARPYRNSIGIAPPTVARPINQPIVVSAPNLASDPKTKGVFPPPPILTQDSRNQISISTSVQAQVQRPVPIQTTFALEDEDDWGEMISSPCAAEGHVGSKIDTLIAPVAPIEKNKGTEQWPPTLVPSMSNLVGAMPDGSQGMIPACPEAWPISDISILDSKPGPRSQGGQAAQVRKEDQVIGAETPVRDIASFDTLGQRPTSRSDASNEKGSGSEKVANEAFLDTTPQKGSTVTSDTVSSTGNGGQDDIIVQKILQSLPDLSYMLG